MFSGLCRDDDALGMGADSASHSWIALENDIADLEAAAHQVAEVFPQQFGGDIIYALKIADVVDVTMPGVQRRDRPRLKLKAFYSLVIGNELGRKQF